jgi:hypothetical protein
LTATQAPQGRAATPTPSAAVDAFIEQRRKLLRFHEIAEYLATIDVETLWEGRPKLNGAS